MKEFIALNDVIEISIIFVLISKLLIWLSRSSTHILEYAYIIIGLYLAAYFCSFIALQSILHVGLPCLVIALLLLHQRIIQHSYLTAQLPCLTNNWLEICCKYFIQTKSASHYCIIEGNQPLDYFLNAPFLMNLSINIDVLELIKQHNNSCSVWWITKQGNLRSDHALINTKRVVSEVSLHEFLCKMAFQTDCCVLIKQNNTHISLLYAGKKIENITLSAAIRCIRTHIEQSSIESNYDKKIYKEYSI